MPESCKPFTTMAEVRVAMRRAFGVPCKGPLDLSCHNPTVVWNGEPCPAGCPYGR
jgi:hypothetical protein